MSYKRVDNNGDVHDVTITGSSWPKRTVPKFK